MRRVHLPSNELLLYCYMPLISDLMKAKNIIIQFWSINRNDSIFSLYVVLNIIPSIFIFFSPSHMFLIFYYNFKSL